MTRKTIEISIRFTRSTFALIQWKVLQTLNEVFGPGVKALASTGFRAVFFYGFSLVQLAL